MAYCGVFFLFDVSFGEIFMGIYDEKRFGATFIGVPLKMLLQRGSEFLIVRLVYVSYVNIVAA